MRLRKKYRDVQPWLDYFEMLQTYEKCGYLQTEPEKNEAYVTQPALYTLAGVDFSTRELGYDINMPYILKSVMYAVRRIRAYVGWQSQKGEVILSHPFAINVVTPDERHDPLFTILITSRRKWWKLWRWHDSIEVISYR